MLCCAIIVPKAIEEFSEASAPETQLLPATAEILAERAAATLLGLPVRVVAEQWTRLEAVLFRTIPLLEFFGQRSSAPRYQHKAPMLRRLIDRFNAGANTWW